MASKDKPRHTPKKAVRKTLKQKRQDKKGKDAKGKRQRLV